jgi:thiamine-monophosphate kinase
MSTVRDLGEFGLIQRVTHFLPSSEGVVEGIGDDCAVLRVGDRLLLATCDASIEEVHFSRALAPPEAIGWKAAASALSDIAAMGGQPLFMLITLACPIDTPVTTVDALYEGFRAAAEHAGAIIAGGDTTQSLSGIIIDITVLGEAQNNRYVLRRGAQAGDVLAVSGYPGRSAAGLIALQQGLDAPELIAAHLHPLPRISEGQWLAALAEVHAMIDLSDGLLQDAGHLAEAAGIGIDIDAAALPMDPGMCDPDQVQGGDPLALALCGGEDYELVIALDADSVAPLAEAFADHFNLPLTPVGRFTAEWTDVRVNGVPQDLRGYEHFRR